MMHASGAAQRFPNSVQPCRACSEQGFSLVEFLLATLVMLIIAGSVFTLLSQTESTASYQTEVQGVLENTRIAMETVERILQQAANDPLKAGFPGVIITSSMQVRVQSDITGSGPGVDKGDPDGATDDTGEDYIIRYNAGGRTIELVTPAGTVQPIASNITAFSMQYFDRAGAATAAGNNVCRVRISLTGTSPVRDLQTGDVFAMQLTSDVQLANRQ